MTTRGKTTPSSTNGSWAPHAGRVSRVEPDTTADATEPETEELADSWATHDLKHPAPTQPEDAQALTELRRRHHNGYEVSGARIYIRPTQCLQLVDAHVPLTGAGPMLLGEGIPLSEVADAHQRRIDLYTYKRARAGGRPDNRINPDISHGDVIAALNAGANLYDFGMLTGHGIPPDEARDAARNNRIDRLAYLAVRETGGCTHAQAIELANAGPQRGYRFEAQTTYNGLREQGCSHAHLVEALTHTPADDPTGLRTLAEYRNLLWDVPHEAAIRHLATRR